MSLRSFIAVAKLKSFTQAATVLQVSQPRLTAQIKKLEDALRLRLSRHQRARGDESGLQHPSPASVATSMLTARCIAPRSGVSRHRGLDLTSRSNAFSASSRIFDLNGEAMAARTKQRSPIIPPV